MKPPLRLFEVGTDLSPETVPERDLEFLEQLGGPSLIRQAGMDRSRVRVVSTLLHGNEPSGLRAIMRWLRLGELPAVDTIFFIGAVDAARGGSGFAHRMLPGEQDANRCWIPPWDSDQGKVARAVLEQLHEAQPESLVDLHNNTGRNPPYGVSFRLGPAELSLVSFFADRVVHTPIELGTIVEATTLHFPSVTIETGLAGDRQADELAWRGLQSYLRTPEIDFDKPRNSIECLESPVRVCLRSGIELAFGDAPDPSATLTISFDIDRHNFEDLAPGSKIGWLRPGAEWPFVATGPDGRECSKEFLLAESNIVRTRRDFVPIMMTTSVEIAKADCLFYAVQRQS